jgi:hypothetical protein
MKRLVLDQNIIILGAGDRGSASALRLFNCGFRPVFIELDNPLDLHYFRNFSDTVYRGEKVIDDITCKYLGPGFDIQLVQSAKEDRKIPCLKVSDIDTILDLKPDIVIDCSGSFNKAEDLEPENFPCLIRIGNRFMTGVDGHYIIGDTGHLLGKILHTQQNHVTSRVEQRNTINAPFEGVFDSKVSPGDRISERQLIGQLNEINILAPSDGFIGGMLHSGHFIQHHQPMFEIKSQLHSDTDLKSIPVRSYAISGGVLEAVLTFINSFSKRIDQ